MIRQDGPLIETGVEADGSVRCYSKREMLNQIF